MADKVYRVTAMNAVSLFWGVTGNISQLHPKNSLSNDIALPVTIFSWILTTSIVSYGASSTRLIANLALALWAYRILAYL